MITINPVYATLRASDAEKECWDYIYATYDSKEEAVKHFTDDCKEMGENGVICEIRVIASAEFPPPVIHYYL